MVHPARDAPTNYDTDGMIEGDCRALVVAPDVDAERACPPRPAWASSWVDLDESGGVLEVRVPSVGLALSLYVIRPSVADSETACWWVTEAGGWLGDALVGVA
jgi:hypothetical protein